MVLARVCQSEWDSFRDLALVDLVYWVTGQVSARLHGIWDLAYLHLVDPDSVVDRFH